MRTLQLHFPDDALYLGHLLKQTKEARVFRRAQAVRQVMKGQRLRPFPTHSSLPIPLSASGSIALPAKARRGLVDRPRSGRPPKLTCELEQHLNHLVDQDPLHHGALSSQWSCRELATVLARETGVNLAAKVSAVC